MTTTTEQRIEQLEEGLANPASELTQGEMTVRYKSSSQLMQALRYLQSEEIDPNTGAKLKRSRRYAQASWNHSE